MLHSFSPNCDLPFNRDAAHKFVPWIIGLMIFLAIIALVSTNILATQIKHWEQSFKEGFTIEIQNDALNQLSQKQLLYQLQNISGVETAQMIPKTYLSPFIDPFSDDQGNFLVIDVKIRPGYNVNMGQVRRLIAPLGETKIRDHREWRQSSLNFAYTAIFIGILIATFIGLAAVATIAFVARTGLEVHNQTIEILHLVGARHQYIAKQFQSYVLQLARKGSFIGLLLFAICSLSVASLIGLNETMQYLRSFSYTDLVLIIALTPLIGVLLTVLSARFTVLSTLDKTNAW